VDNRFNIDYPGAGDKMKRFKRYSKECGKTGGQNYHMKNYGAQKSAKITPKLIGSIADWASAHPPPDMSPEQAEKFNEDIKRLKEKLADFKEKYPKDYGSKPMAAEVREVRKHLEREGPIYTSREAERQKKKSNTEEWEEYRYYKPRTEYSEEK